MQSNIIKKLFQIGKRFLLFNTSCRSSLPIEQKEYRRLILPLEIKSREYHGRLLLAAVAAERGWAAILGSKYNMGQVLAKERPGALVIEHNITENYGRTVIRPHLDAGRRVCAWCEEGLVYLSRSDYQQRRIHKDVLNMLEIFFLWGEQQASDTLDLAPQMESRLARTGSPRFDYLRPELNAFYRKRINSLKKQYGDYILINTNFGRANHFNGEDWVIKDLLAKNMIRSPAQEQQVRDWQSYQKILFSNFKEMAVHLEESFKSHSIIIRPHPSENVETWKRIFKDSDKVHVVHEGDVTPWLIGADLVIHNSCTTGVQAFLAQRPVIAYRPVTSEIFDSYLPNALSDSAHTLAELVEMAKLLIAGKRCVVDKIKLDIASQYIEALTGPFAAERIISSLDKLDVKEDFVAQEYPWQSVDSCDQRLSFRQPLRYVKNIIRKMLKVNPRQLAEEKSTYFKHKFPGLSLREVRDDLRTLQRVLSRFSDVNAYELDENVFLIVRKT